ncbi:MAG: BrxA/BrxB family bacilliredoxin [Bdellovibrionota bacterium]
MYDPRLVDPMRADLTSAGVEELRTATDVDNAIKNSSGTLLVVVNSVCGCAAGAARPAVKLAMKHSKLPKKAVTVFAGQDKEATERARSYFVGFPPSSPSMALLKDGEVVKMIHRHDIEGYSPAEIAQKLTSAFDEYC